jgi:Na+-transporting NADH:ubiquinone oxidoreductase subunit B
MKLSKPVFLKQKNMINVLYALIPATLCGIYFFGWRVLGVLAIATIFGFLTEWIMQSQKTNGKVSYAVFVSSVLYGLSLPPTIPFWICAVGIIVAILFGKEVFGGFGKNVFNPAIVGRAFVFVTFPVEMTGKFVPVFSGLPGGFMHWSLASLKALPSHLSSSGLGVMDALSAATPMWSRRDFGFSTDLLNLILGNIGQVFSFNGESRILTAGAIGEVSAVALIIGAIYLFITKTALFRLTLATLIGALGLNVLLLYVFKITEVPPPQFSLFSGGLLFCSIFMVTDPVSAPKVKQSQWLYGIFIGAMIIFFRYKSVFAGGVGFAVLLGNTIAPSLDLWIKRFQSRKKVAASGKVKQENAIVQPGVKQ